MKWISIKERLPENDNDVLVYYENTDMEVLYFDENKQPVSFMVGGDMFGSNITHWMPLPNPPEE